MHISAPIQQQYSNTLSKPDLPFILFFSEPFKFLKQLVHPPTCRSPFTQPSSWQVGDSAEGYFVKEMLDKFDGWSTLSSYLVNETIILYIILSSHGELQV